MDVDGREVYHVQVVIPPTRCFGGQDDPSIVMTTQGTCLTPTQKTQKTIDSKNKIDCRLALKF